MVIKHEESPKPSPPVPARAEDDKDKLVGTWECVSATVNGKALPAETVKKLTLVLTKEKYTTRMGEQVLFDGGYKLDATKSPKTMDIAALEGDQKDKPSLGIYAFDGETLKLCYVMPGKQRPKDFESKPDSEATFATWKLKR